MTEGGRWLIERLRDEVAPTFTGDSPSSQVVHEAATRLEHYEREREALREALKRIARFPSQYPDEAKEYEKMAINSVNQGEIAQAALDGKEPWDGNANADPLPALQHAQEEAGEDG